MKKKNEGFTLIEIIVSIAISGVIISVVLSMIVTSFNLFANFSDTKLRKDSLDNIVDYVRSQIQNATEVYIQKDKPDGDGWKWLSVDSKNNMLYRGKADDANGTPVLGASYYNRNSTNSSSTNKTNILSWHGKAYRNDADTSDQRSNNYVRIRFIYNLTVNGSKDHYEKEDTIKFSNIKILGSNENENNQYRGSLSKLPQKPSVQNYNFEFNSSSGSGENLKFYYRSPETSKHNTDNQHDSGNQPDTPKVGSISGTIEDKLTNFLAIHPWLNRGYFVGEATDVENQSYFKLPIHNKYNIGDFVYYQGYWYMKKDNKSVYNPPGADGSAWQRIDENYMNNMTYYKGDVIKYNQKYYRCIMNPSTSYNPPDSWNVYDPSDNNSTRDGKRWELIGDKPIKDNLESANQTGFDTTFSGLESEYKQENNNESINLTRLESVQIPANSPLNDPKRSKYQTTSTDYADVEKFDSNKKYEVGDIVKVLVPQSGRNGSNTDHPYYRLYKKIFDPSTEDPNNLMKLTEEDKKPGGSYMSGWKLLENEYMPTSSYETGDTVRFGFIDTANKNNDKNYIQFQNISGLLDGMTFNVNHLDSLQFEVYFGMKYKFLKSYQVTNQNGKPIITSLDYYDNWSGRNSNLILRKAFIYNPGKHLVNNNWEECDDSVEKGNSLSGKSDNKKVRDEIWQAKSPEELQGA